MTADGLCACFIALWVNTVVDSPGFLFKVHIVMWRVGSMLGKSFISILCRNAIIPFFVARYRSLPRWRVQKWERGIENLSP